MASQSLPIQADGQLRQQESAARGQQLTSGAIGADSWLLVAGFADAVAADYAAYVCRLGAKYVAVVADEAVNRHVNAPARVFGQRGFSPTALKAASERSHVGGLVLFLKPRLTDADRRDLEDLLRLAGDSQTGFVGIVSTFRVHLGDRDSTEAETFVLDRAKGLHARTIVFRPGHVLSRNSRASTNLRRLGFTCPLVPKRLRSCFVDGDELFSAIEDQRQAAGPRGPRLFTVLGPNRPWRGVLGQHAGAGLWRAGLRAVSALLSLLLVGHIAGVALDLLARHWPSLRHWNFDTVCPRSFRELLALCCKYNWRHVKVVGYNNGVNHFGQRYPGKTIVSTVNCSRAVLNQRRLLRASNKNGSGTVAGTARRVLRTTVPDPYSLDTLKADCGTTVRRALDVLNKAGLELPVVPNYSYVCLGTAFFIPIHGSAGDFSTVADTITRVLLYDPLQDRLIAATSDQSAFQNNVYNLRADILLLRVHLRVKPKSRYYVRKEVLKDPTSADLLDSLRDGRATNVEIRKSSACSSMVTVSKYYKDPGDSLGPMQELPRDSLGRLWDKLEENRLTSFLMHALTRHFAYHLELFFTAAEFAAFWKTHRALPLRKLQFRYIRRDGLPHSPFREHDCIAVDLFMLRRHRRRFQTYLKQAFPGVRTNPGKHSR